MRRLARPFRCIAGAALVISTLAAADPLTRVPGTIFATPVTGVGGNRIGRVLSGASAAERPVSRATPFTQCGGSGGILYVNAEVEPHLAVNPRNPDHWIATWQQDRWSSGSARGIVSAATFDAGASWTHVAPPFSQCAGGALLRATDPWVTFAADGTAYQIAIATTGGAFAAGSVNAVLVSRSIDGVAWSTPRELIRDTAPFFNDKETITADPFDAAFVYAAWDRLQGETAGPSYFARTTDGGATWEASRAIYDPRIQFTGPSQTIGNVIRVLPDGTLVDLFTLFQGDERGPEYSTLQAIRSSDRGATWSLPSKVANYQPLGLHDPSTGKPVRDGTPIAEAAVSPDGALYVAWQDGRFTGERDAIAISVSRDAGSTWTTPARVNADASVAAFAPQVHVAPDGTIGVTYYDLRPATAAMPLLTDYWLAQSKDGVTWSETRVAGPFDLAMAPDAGGLFLGDYMGLASAHASFLALHARTTNDPLDRTDIFLSRIPVAAGTRAYGPTEAKGARADDAQFLLRVASNLRGALARRRASVPPAPDIGGAMR